MLRQIAGQLKWNMFRLPLVGIILLGMGETLLAVGLYIMLANIFISKIRYHIAKLLANYLEPCKPLLS